MLLRRSWYTQLLSVGGIAGGPGSLVSLEAIATYASFIQLKAEEK
jgi:hypothetical protein